MADERVVSETNIGSSNPIARYGRDLVSSIKGIGTGFIMVLIGFVILYYSVGMKESSGTVAKLALTPADQVATTQVGLVKISGKPSVPSALAAPKTSESVIYYKYTTEEYRKVEQTKTSYKTVQKDGQDVQQTVETKEYVDTWVPVTTTEKWNTFKLGAVTVDPKSANGNYNLKSIYDQETVAPVAANPTLITPITYAGKTANAFPITKTREKVVGVPADQNIIVIGEVANGTISAGDPFIVSNKSDAEIVKDLKSSENLKFWLMKGAAWFFLAFGLMSIFGPVFALLNILPGVGSALSGIMFVVFAIVSAILVALGSLVIKFWYVFIGLVVVAIIAAITMRNK